MILIVKDAYELQGYLHNNQHQFSDGSDFPKTIVVAPDLELINHEVLSNEGVFIQTSGTTGKPKMIRCMDVEHLLWLFNRSVSESVVSFFSDHSFATLQFIGSLTRSSCDGPVSLAGTPSMFRAKTLKLLKWNNTQKVKDIVMGGEVVTQDIIDRCFEFYKPQRVIHSYASTEFGLVFRTTDGKAGHKMSDLKSPHKVAEIINGTLHLDGKDTGDLAEMRDDRLFILGRSDSDVINVGGRKISASEIESQVNRIPGVKMSQVASRESPITGRVIKVLIDTEDPGHVKPEVMQMIISNGWPDMQIKFGEIKLNANGKMIRATNDND